MGPVLQRIGQRKAAIIALAAVGVVIVFVGIFSIMSIPAKKQKVVTTESPAAALNDMRQDQENLKQTLEQEKIDRAKVRQALDASTNYQKLAQ